MDLQEKYVNPLTDWGFNKLFGTEPNKELLIDFLNQLLPEQHTIQDLTYTVNEQLGVGRFDRGAIFDLAAVYTIGILDFKFLDGEDEPQLLHVVKLKDQECRIFYDKLTYIYLELPKFQKPAEALEGKYEKWLYVFRHLADLQNRPPQLQERIFEKLFEAAAIANFSPEEQRDYEASLKYFRDMNNVIETAHQEGVELGKAEEREKADLEMKRMQLETPRKLKAAGVEVAVIAEATGLLEKEIESL